MNNVVSKLPNTPRKILIGVFGLSEYEFRLVRSVLKLTAMSSGRTFTYVLMDADSGDSPDIAIIAHDNLQANAQLKALPIRVGAADPAILFIASTAPIDEKQYLLRPLAPTKMLAMIDQFANKIAAVLSVARPSLTAIPAASAPSIATRPVVTAPSAVAQPVSPVTHPVATAPLVVAQPVASAPIATRPVSPATHPVATAAASPVVAQPVSSVTRPVATATVPPAVAQPVASAPIATRPVSPAATSVVAPAVEVRPVNRPSPPIQQVPKIQVSKPGFRALIVDDSPTVRIKIAQELRHLNIASDCAGTGEQGLQILGQHSYDIIFLDIVLPGIDGYETCKTLRHNPLTKRIPVVMLTSKSSPFDRIRGSLAGCSCYLTKPVNPEKFRSVVENYLIASEVQDASSRSFALAINA